MKRFSYGERDYAFGQAMLTLRTSIGLTQAGLAERLRVTRKAISRWEAGDTYPKASHLKALLALAVGQQAFPAGREEEEIRAFWHAAHQKVLLDESWLQGLLGAQRPRLSLVAPRPVEQTHGAEHGSATLFTSDKGGRAETSRSGFQVPPVTSDKGGIDETSRSGFQVPPAAGEPRVDWGEALDVPSFYGRMGELALLTQWVVQERCRVVSVLGLGGIGKSALAVSLMHQIAPHFEVVIWRSLRDAPSCEALLDECLQVLAPQPLGLLPASLERRLSLLMEHLRDQRALVILDNLETLLEEGEGTGRMRPGYEGYAQLLHRVGETAHQSCLLLTSREKVSSLALLEGSRKPVRALHLAGLDAVASRQLLEEREMVGSAHDRARLAEVYAGNPLALNIVAQTIVELFGGEIAAFLEQGEVVFGSVRELLDEQFVRLSALEQSALLWLAIVREPVNLDELLALPGAPKPRGQVLEAVDRLSRRSLIERGKRPGSFTLQAVVLEYATARLITEAASEIEQGRLARLIEHGLSQATAKEYVRQAQERLIVVPLLAQVRSAYPQQAAVEGHLLSLLDQLRAWADYAQGYGPANVLALLRQQRGHLRGLDLSHLSIRGAYLHGVEMQDASLARASLRETVFNEAFDITWAVAISRDGQYWAAGSRRGEVRVWREEGRLLHLAWQAHSDTVRALAFSPDGRTLATGSWDGAIKLWDIESGALLWTSWFTDNIESLAFAPDGCTLASGGDDATVQLWDAHSGAHRQTLSGHSGPVFALAWSPDGSLLASGGAGEDIRLWELSGAQPGTSVRMLAGHTNWVLGLAFAPDGTKLASGSWDYTVRLWDVASGNLRQTLTGHTDRVRAVVWSPDGQLLACGTYQRGLQVWDVAARSLRWADRAQVTWIRRVAWSPDGTRLVGGDEDGHVYVWDASDGTQLLRLAGHHGAVTSVAWSPDGTRLVSGGGSQGQGGGELFVWEVQRGERHPAWGAGNSALVGHPGVVSAVTWAPSGQRLISGGSDGRLRWWEVHSGECVREPCLGDRYQEAH
ncbi:MAG: NB-ARC domain-containing protein, partial [Ktedonobacteraceae bacterium]